MIVISVLAVVAVTGFALLAWLRSGRRWRVAVVECLRVALVIFAVAMLWQPESTIQIDSDLRSEVVLLIDRSGSMQTRDAGSATETTTEAATRNAIADRIRNDAGWSRLDDRFNRVEFDFADQTGGSSDLAAALDDAARRHDSAVAFVLISDGDFNQGRSPVRAAAEIATRSAGGSRVLAIPIGGVDRMPDIELASADVPTFGVMGKPVRIPFTVRNWFPDLRDVTVSLREGTTVKDRQTVPIRDGGRYDGSFMWQSSQAGSYELTVQVSVEAAETDTSNNTLTKTIEIREEKLRVLVIESEPRWEYRYLRNALVRDPGIDVSCLLFQPGVPGVGGGGGDYLSAMPEETAELASYDVIFLGDVGVAAEQLTVEHCRQIRGLVEQQAVGLVLMPGIRGNQASLLQSDLGELIPVVMDPSHPLGIGNESPGSFSLTNSGRRSLLTQLDDDSQSNWSVWESLPGFYWHAAVTRAKAGSEVLAVHESSSNQYGRLPLLVTRSAGAGKVLFMGSDSVWRWRMGVEDKYHYRFWGQAIRWMAYQRNMAVGETMRLSYSPEQPFVAETVTLRASVMNSDGTPSQEDAAIVAIRPPVGDVHRVRLERADSQWGVFQAQTQFDAIGTHAMELQHPSEKSVVTAGIAVQGRAVEQVGRPARPDIMREVAKVGRGSTFAPDQISQLVDQLNQLPPDPSSMRRIQWWNHPAVMSAMIAALALFWIGRKWAGAV